MESCHLFGLQVLHCFVSGVLTGCAVRTVWQAATLAQVYRIESGTGDVHCTRWEEREVFAFTFFYYHGNSNYYHLHLDTLYPLYQELEARGHLQKLLAGEPVDYVLAPATNVHKCVFVHEFF